MSATDSRPDHEPSPLLGLGCNEGLGPLPDADWTPGAALNHSAEQMRAYSLQERERMANEIRRRLAEQAAMLYAEMDTKVASERERCAMKLQVTRAEVQLAAGELSTEEWRMCAAVLRWMQGRIRGPNVRAKLAPTVKRRARAAENAHLHCSAGPVLCCWGSA